MSEQDRYIPGVPCWIDTTQPDPAAAAAFYGDLFGWEMEDVMPADSPMRYFMGRLRRRRCGRRGFAAGGRPGAGGMEHVHLGGGCDETADRVRAAGGTVLMEPGDVGDSGRMAVFADPEGAAFSVWQPKTHRGATVVNEHGSLNFNNLAHPGPRGRKVVLRCGLRLGDDRCRRGSHVGAPGLRRLPREAHPRDAREHGEHGCP